MYHFFDSHPLPPHVEEGAQKMHQLHRSCHSIHSIRSTVCLSCCLPALPALCCSVCPSSTKGSLQLGSWWILLLLSCEPHAKEGATTSIGNMSRRHNSCSFPSGARPDPATRQRAKTTQPVWRLSLNATKSQSERPQHLYKWGALK